MPMTHVPEISAEYPYQKTGTISRHDNRACPINYQKLYQKSSVPNCMLDASETGVSC